MQFLFRFILSVCFVANLLPAPVRALPLQDRQLTVEQEEQLAKANRLSAEAVKLHRQGKSDEAIVYIKQSLEIRKNVLGHEHLDTANAYNNLGSFLLADGDYAEAELNYLEALEITRKVLGRSHPTTVYVFNNLSKLIEKRAAQPNRPLTKEMTESLTRATQLHNDGVKLGRRGNTIEAITLVKESLEIRRKILGAEHFETANCLANLGVIYNKKRDYTNAEACCEQAIAIYQKVLGKSHLMNAKALDVLGKCLKDQAKLSAAVPHFEEILRIKTENLGLEHADSRAALRSLGELYFAQEDYDYARLCFVQELEINNKVFGAGHAETVVSLDNLGTVYFKLEDYASAKPYYELSLKIRRKVFGDNHVQTSFSLENLGNLLRCLGDYQNAKPYLLEALKIQRRVWGKHNPQTMVAVTNLADLLQAQGEYAEAGELYMQSLAICREAFGEDDLNTAIILNNLGALRHTQGDFNAAISYYRQALEIKEKVFGKQHFQTVGTINNLGILLKDHGDYQAARVCLEDALRISKQANNQPAIASALYDLGDLYHDEGNYSIARAFHEQALEIRKRVLGDEHPDTANSLNSFGMLHRVQGDSQGAQPYYEQALEIARKVLGDKHPTTATYLNNLASLLKDQRNYDDAKDCYEQAVRIAETTLGKGHPRTAIYLSNLGSLIMDQGDLAAARPYLERALQIRNEALGAAHPDTANSLNTLGLLSSKLGNQKEASTYLHQALQIGENILGPDHPDTIGTLSNLVVMEMASGNIQEAMQLEERVQRGMHRHVSRLLPALSEKEQLVFLEDTFESGFHAALSLAVSQRTNAKIAEMSANWLLNGKANAQRALAQRNLLTRDALNPELTETVQKLKRARGELATLALRAPAKGQEQVRRDEIERLSAEETTLARQIVLATGGREQDGIAWITLESVRSRLRQGTVLSDMARYYEFDFQAKAGLRVLSPRYAAWVIPAAGQGDVAIVDLGLAGELESTISNVNQAIASAAKAESVARREGDLVAMEQLSDDLSEVAKLVWQPLAEKIPSETRQLILSPDGAMWLLPWAALPVETDKYLLEDYSICFEIGGRELVRGKADATETTKPLIFADPDYDLDAKTAREVVRSLFPRLDLQVDSSQALVAAGTALPKAERLPYTKLEAAAVVPNMAKVAGIDPQQFTDQYALETVIKHADRPKILMLSTHGFFLPDQEAVKRPDVDLTKSENSHSVLLTVDGTPIENPLLRCGLMFAGCNTQQAVGGDEGVLTGMEVVGMDLRGTELVVLSACDSGVGKVNNGEGVAGLRQAFQLAGAESVVATLWQVPDRDSSLIMNDFFAGLALGQSRPEALRNAQLARIESRRNRFGAAHPYFWAAWTITGD